MSDGGDLYDDDMGDDVTGGSVRFGDHGAHHNVHGDGGHFSWDDDYDDRDDPYGHDVHGTDHGDHGPLGGDYGG